MDKCINGHDIVDGDIYCGVCGAEAPPLPASPPSVVGEARSCPNGHSNPEGFEYCGTCGAAIDLNAPPKMRPLIGSGDGDGRSNSKKARLVWIGIGLICIVVIAAVVMSTQKSNSTSATDDTAYEDTTTTTLISDVCVQELSEWMPYITGSGHSLTDAIVEFGYASPDLTIIRDAYGKYMSNLYQLGRNKASDLSYALLADECATLGDRYEAGHHPPTD